MYVDYRCTSSALLPLNAISQHFQLLPKSSPGSPKQNLVLDTSTSSRGGEIGLEISNNTFRLTRPAFLQVPTSARKEALKTYQPCFGTKSASPSPISFTHDLSTFFFDLGVPEHHDGSPKNIPDSGKIHSLTFEASALLAHYNNGMRMFRELTCVRELKISGCHSVICDEIHQLDSLPMQLLEEPKDRGQLVPVLTCLEGARCRKHWWFQNWNRRVGLRRMRSSVNQFMVARMMALLEPEEEVGPSAGLPRGVHLLDWMSRTECVILNILSPE